MCGVEKDPKGSKRQNANGTTKDPKGIKKNDRNSSVSAHMESSVLCWVSGLSFKKFQFLFF